MSAVAPNLRAEPVAGAAVATNYGFADAPVAAPALEGAESRELTYLAAIREALWEEMARDPNVLVIGEDVADPFGGAFKVTKGLSEQYGERRVLNMPMSELGFVGAATGMALMGLRPVIEMQFADFITTAFDSIVQFAATNYYRWKGAVPWVIRAPSDGGLRSGPFHSQNPEAWFVHAPGLKVVAPATPADAKGLLIAAIRDNNPVIYFESKLLYRSLKGYVPAGDYVAPIGQARVARTGGDLSIIAYGAQVHQALEAAERLAAEGVQAEVLDLRTLKPLDEAAILATARKTGKLLIVHSANRLAGVGAEVAAIVAEQAFEWLDAPIYRLGGLDVPV
ncbi:MAG TPA: alpha-ketoacid dehydrogenase subunit beta, partial [Caldilineaceae bacterium]|nr:alpha-ketoacid dehydrogenase subunit beta [Caldilineaceae bacterium]